MKKIVIVFFILIITINLMSCSGKEEKILDLSALIQENMNVYKKLIITSGRTGVSKETENQKIINKFLNELENYKIKIHNEEQLNGYNYSAKLIYKDNEDNKGSLSITDNKFGTINELSFDIIQGYIDLEQYFNMLP